MEDLELLTDFIIEGLENLANMDGPLLELEEDPSNIELVDVLFRNIHSVKGASGMFEMNDVMHIAHEMETILGKIKNLAMKINGEIIDLLLKGNDLLKSFFREFEKSLKESGKLGVLEGDPRAKTLIDALKELDTGELKTDVIKKQVTDIDEIVIPDELEEN